MLGIEEFTVCPVTKGALLQFLGLTGESTARVVPPPWPESRSGSNRYGPPSVASACIRATIFTGSYGGASLSFIAGTNAITG